MKTAWLDYWTMYCVCDSKGFDLYNGTLCVYVCVCARALSVLAVGSRFFFVHCFSSGCFIFIETTIGAYVPMCNSKWVWYRLNWNCFNAVCFHHAKYQLQQLHLPQLSEIPFLSFHSQCTVHIIFFSVVSVFLFLPCFVLHVFNNTY